MLTNYCQQARLTAGTVVTKESFAVWKEAFNAEMKSKEESDTAASKSEKVLTGVVILVLAITTMINKY